MKTLRRLLGSAFLIFLAGALAGLGIRATEWVIRPPEARIVVCMDEGDDTATCRNAREVLDKYTATMAELARIKYPK